MNRNKSPNSAENTSNKKRRLKSPESKETKSEEKTKTAANEADEDDYEEQEESFRNRKSLRIKNKTQTTAAPSSGVTPKKGKETAATSLTTTPLATSTTPAAKQKATSNTSTTSSSASSSSASESRKLNGAQFVAAAAAGNFNVSASIGSTSITIDSNSSQDLSQLNHNVEVLTKTIAQHSILLKQLNGSIEKLSNKIDLAKSATKRQTAKSRQTSTKQASKRQKHNDVDLNDSLDERITLDDSQAEEEQQEEDENESEKDDEHETINSKSQQLAQQKLQEINEQTSKEATEDVAEQKTELIIKENDKSPVKQAVASSPTTSASHQLAGQVNELNNVVNEPVTQTVKLTNIESISEENPRQSANSFYFLSDSSKSDDDDDDDDDDDENEGSFNQESQDGKKSKRSSHGQKSPTKAILNKTKIDTEFISKLIANKDPNDKRYDPNEINKLRLLSHSYQNFAVKLLIRLFDEDEIIGRNVYGRNYSGDKSFMKQPLDPERINFIRETVLKLTKTNNPELAWASCVIAMNRKMVDINNKFIKNHKNSTNNSANTTV